MRDTHLIESEDIPMPSKHPYRIAICILILFGFSPCLADPSEIDPYPDVEIPIYHNGYKVTQEFNDLTHTKTIVYHVRTDPPAHEVIVFYDAQLNARGWRSSFEICQRSWEPFSDSENTDPPTTAGCRD